MFKKIGYCPHATLLVPWRVSVCSGLICFAIFWIGCGEDEKAGLQINIMPPAVPAAPAEATKIQQAFDQVTQVRVRMPSAEIDEMFPVSGRETRVILGEIPIGAHTVLVELLAAGDKVLFTGQTSANIVEGTIAQAAIKMNPTADRILSVSLDITSDSKRPNTGNLTTIFTATIDALDTHYDPSLLLYELNWGDGSPVVKFGQQEATQTYQYTKEGKLTVRAKVISIDGRTEDAEPTEITIRRQKIAFSTNRDGNFEIYVMNIDGSNPTRLTSNGVNDSDPTWSGDGTQIAFGSFRTGNASEIYVMDADGSKPGINITNDPVADNGPVWSKDDKIVFSSRRDGNLEIYVMNVDGSDVTRLTFDPQDDNFADWSPDGQQIAFKSRRDGDGKKSEIYVMDRDGANQRPLTIGVDAQDNQRPAWSPDGAKIVFDSLRDGNWDIYVMNTDGSDQQRLTDDPAFDGWADWSPDGTKIAFVSDRDENKEIYVMNTDGSNQTNLTNSAADDTHPAWSPLP